MLKAAGLEYEVVGDGEPVLMIHGAIVADTMLPLSREPALAGGYRLIRYRNRGYGGSDPASGGLTLAGAAQDASALLRELDVERAHLVGHSGGGAMATALALEAPERVHSLVVLEPAIMPPEVSAAFLGAVAPVLEAYRSGDVFRAIDLWMDAVSVKDWRNGLAGALPGAVEQAGKDASTFFETELPSLSALVFDPERTRRISQPVLHVLGGESGPLFEQARRYFQTLVPHTESVVVPGVDHALLVQDPNGVAAVIAEFLGRHPL